MPESYFLQQQALFNTPLDFTTVTPDSIAKLIAQYTETAQATYYYVASQTTLTFANVLQPLINLEIAARCLSPLATTLQHVHPDQAVRDASSTAETQVNNLEVELSMREDAYKVIAAYYQHQFPSEASSLTDEERRYVTNMMRRYKRSGLSLETAEQKAQAKRLQQRINELKTQFTKNLSEDKTSFEVSREELDGIPATWFTDARKIRDDIYRVTLRYPDVEPIIQFCNNRELRKKIAIAFNTRCEKQNTAIAIELLQCRQELALLLGYDSWADYSTEIKMTKQGATVEQFLREMRERFTPLQVKTLAALEQYARDKTGDRDFALQHYDVTYFIKMREKELCCVDHKAIQDYFPRDKVVNGTLAIYQQILGLRFVFRDTSNKWHMDTQWYDVFDAKSGELLGSFILDLAPRDGKYSHNAMEALVTNADISIFSGKAGDRQPHLAMVMCNFPADECLNFGNVTTFLHEFGHVMHHICSATKIPSMGMAAVERDFIEAPSQMLENWAYDARVLELLSAHKDTGLPIPAEMVARLHDAENMHVAIFYQRQLYYGCFDYMVHALNAQQLEKLDLTAFGQRLNSDISLLPDPGYAFGATFMHVFGSSGYDVGYYGYLYSKVVALDMFETLFKKDPLSAKAGEQYRKEILQPGGTRDAIDMVQNLLGRMPSIDAFLHDCGLEPKVESKAKAARLTA